MLLTRYPGCVSLSEDMNSIEFECAVCNLQLWPKIGETILKVDI